MICQIEEIDNNKNEKDNEKNEIEKENNEKEEENNSNSTTGYSNEIEYEDGNTNEEVKEDDQEVS